MPQGIRRSWNSRSGSRPAEHEHGRPAQPRGIAACLPVAPAERRSVHGDRRWLGARSHAIAGASAAGGSGDCRRRVGRRGVGRVDRPLPGRFTRSRATHPRRRRGFACTHHRQRGRHRSRVMGVGDRGAVKLPAFRSAGIAFLFAALTVAMTWPQAARLSTHVYNSDDPLLSIWRLSWIAHILPESPTDILNGNIFHPEKRTLAYTDSTLLEGLTAAPLIWAGVSPITTYNVLLLALIALSGWAMWRYAWDLTGHNGAAILAGIVFAFVPYRFDHLHHLELQATIFLPLTLLYFERTLQTGSRRDAALMTASYVAEVLSCIYYSIFLATALAPIAAVRVWRLPADTRARVIRVTWPAAVAGMIVVAPYAYAYTLNRATLGDRLESDVLLYSATVSNYLATTAANVIHGGWSASFGQSERYWFPGAIAMVLAACGLYALDRRRLSLLAIGATGFVISLGLNTPVYGVMRAVLLPYRGLRAPARASILVYVALAALAAYGWSRLMRGRSKPFTSIATLAVAALLLVEFRTRL